MGDLTKTIFCLIVIYQISLASPIFANRERTEELKVLNSKIPNEENNGDIFHFWKSLFSLVETVYEKIISALKMVIHNSTSKENKSMYYKRIV